MSKAILVLDDMPKSCGNCILANEDYDVCQATQKSISYDKRGYGFECPLKPLPKGHGDLKDAERLKEVFRRNTGHDYHDLIDNAPTIVEADKGEE